MFQFRRGPQTIVWAPPAETPARTYVLRLEAIDSASNLRGYGALTAFTARKRLQHVKPHGALYNMAAKDRALADALAQADAAAASSAAAASKGSNSLELGPEASLRWTLGEAEVQPAENKQPQFLFGLNGVRAMLPTADAQKVTATAHAEQVATPESAHQTLAASLILGALLYAPGLFMLGFQARLKASPQE